MPEAPTRNERAVTLIDEGIATLADRSLVDTNTMTDLLLDIRGLITEPGVQCTNHSEPT